MNCSLHCFHDLTVTHSVFGVSKMLLDRLMPLQNIQLCTLPSLLIFRLKRTRVMMNLAMDVVVVRVTA